MAPFTRPGIFYRAALCGSFALALPTSVRDGTVVVKARDGGVPEPLLNIVPQSRVVSWLLFVFFIAGCLGIVICLINYSPRILSWIRKKVGGEKAAQNS